MKITFITSTLILGGIEKSIELLSKELMGIYDIDVVYIKDDILDSNIVEQISKYCNVYKFNYENINTDFCIWCNIYEDFINFDVVKNYIYSKKHIAWIHSKPRELSNCLLDRADYMQLIDEYVCVSEEVKKNIKVDKEGIVIHNFINSEILKLSKKDNPFAEKYELKLVVVSRISSGKGFERLKVLVDVLEENKINYELLIVGNGRKRLEEYKDLFKKYSRVKFVGPKENPYPYIVNADYLVQLSDYETWCLSITEAKVLGIPVIATNFTSIGEQIKDGYNGIVIDINDTNYNKYLSDILDNKEKYKQNSTTYIHENEIDKWLKILK